MMFQLFRRTASPKATTLVVQRAYSLAGKIFAVPVKRKREGDLLSRESCLLHVYLRRQMTRQMNHGRICLCFALRCG